jgi:hypothetical protein
MSKSSAEKFHTSLPRFIHDQELGFLKLAGSIAHHWTATRTAHHHHHHMCQFAKPLSLY